MRTSELVHAHGTWTTRGEDPHMNEQIPIDAQLTIVDAEALGWNTGVVVDMETCTGTNAQTYKHIRSCYTAGNGRFAITERNAGSGQWSRIEVA